MSQFRVRKVPSVANGDCGRNRPFTAKASGDAVTCDLRRKEPCDVRHQSKRDRSKSKLPKNVRNDLESALVGLCDVWFEDIKPHLIRNNIKVHFHGATQESGDHDDVVAGDCSHVHPGAASDRHRRRSANCAGCCSRHPTASRARCRRPPTPPVPRLPLPRTPPSPQQPITPRSRKCKGKSQKCQLSPSSKSNWRVPRLCHTYSNLSPTATPRYDNPNIRTATQKKHRFQESLENQTRKKDKSTQTEPVTIRPSTAIKLSPKSKIMQANKGPQISDKLFPDDLIDRIVENQDKKLKLLYISPKQVEYPSLYNLAQSTHTGAYMYEPCQSKKPWR